MREYLYLCDYPSQSYVLASGLHFQDFLDWVPRPGGVLLLKHNYCDALRDSRTGFDFVPIEDLAALAADNTYGYGDFSWTEYHGSPPDLSDEAIADLLFFSHMNRPRSSVSIRGLENQHLFCAHDDGWRLKLYYSDWTALATKLQQLVSTKLNGNFSMGHLDTLHQCDCALWLESGFIEREARSDDIDGLQQKRRKRAN